MEVYLIILIASLIFIVLYIHHRSRENTRKLRQKRLKIPRIIHQTYKANDLHADLRENVRVLRERNPNYEYRFYSDEDIVEFIRNNYPSDILETYQMINPEYGPARADYFRYLLMYKVGGVYLDIKSNCDKSFDEIINEEDEIILTHWKDRWGYDTLHNDYGEYCQWVMMNVPGHPLLKRVINEVSQNIRSYTIQKGVGKFGVLAMTGPWAYYRAIHPDIHNHKVRLSFSEKQLGLSYNNCPQNHIDIFKNHYTKLETPVAGKIYTHPLYVTLTTIPERLRDPWFYENLQNLLKLNGDYIVVLNVPSHMKSTGEPYVVPSKIRELQGPRFKIHPTGEDYGPLTKLYGSLLNEDIHPESPLLVCDDDIHYKENFVKNIKREYYKDPRKLYAYCDKGIAGYQGFLVQKKRILPILGLRRPNICFRIDDDFISHSVDKLGIERMGVSYEGDTSWTCSMDQKKTDTHPAWGELASDNRQNMSHSCREEFHRMN